MALIPSLTTMCGVSVWKPSGMGLALFMVILGESVDEEVWFVKGRGKGGF